MKRILSVFLVLLLTFSVGTTAFAAVDDTGFSDVASDSWYAEAVTYVRDNGIMSGTSATTFAPENTMTRAMLATVLYRIAGNPVVTGRDTFTDTEPDTWYGDAVLWTVQQQIVSGYGNGLFGTNDPVSREQIATILWRNEGQPSMQDSSVLFDDEQAISAYALRAVQWARSNGIINGKPDNLFDPHGSATRAEVATILYNYLTQKSPATPDIPTDENKTLVAYFSMPETTDPDNMTQEEDNSTVVVNGEVLGNTQYVAYVIQENTGADIFRIEPETPYPTDHDTLVDLAAEEQDQAARPAIKNHIENLEQYDTIFIGYPNWWGDMPMILYSFFDEYDFSGKTIVPFNTHGGSGFSNTISTIAGLEPGANVNENGFTVSRNNVQEAESDIIAWLNESGF